MIPARRWSWAVAILIPVVALAQESGAPPARDEPPELNEAREAVGVFLGELMGRLFQELHDGGVTQAVAVCSEVAPKIPVEIGLERGVVLRRTTLKARNPQNAPTVGERARLERWSELHTAGKLPREEWEVVSRDGQAWLDYYRPIRVQKVCLQCHGPVDMINPAVRKLLGEKYSADAATGYREGDLRGMVVARVPIVRTDRTPPSAP